MNFRIIESSLHELYNHFMLPKEFLIYKKTRIETYRTLYGTFAETIDEQESVKIFIDWFKFQFANRWIDVIQNVFHVLCMNIPHRRAVWFCGSYDSYKENIFSSLIGLFYEQSTTVRSETLNTNFPFQSFIGKNIFFLNDMKYSSFRQLIIKDCLFYLFRGKTFEVDYRTRINHYSNESNPMAKIEGASLILSYYDNIVHPDEMDSSIFRYDVLKYEQDQNILNLMQERQINPLAWLDIFSQLELI